MGYGHLAEEAIRGASRRVLRRPVLKASVRRLASGSSVASANLRNSAGALDKIAAGHGRMFLVSGEPGIGKTGWPMTFWLGPRLAWPAGRLWGRCWARAGSLAYWPIIQIIRVFAERPDFAQLAEGLASAIEHVAALVPEDVRPAPVGKRTGLRRIDPEQVRFRLFDAVATLFKSVAHASLWSL